VVAFLLTIGLLALLLELQSPSAVLWTGRPVTGIERGGVVLYPFNGHMYTLIDPDQPESGPTRTVLVYVDPGNLSNSRLDKASTRWLDASFVLAPFLVAFLLIALAFIRRFMHARTPQRQGEGFGRGFRPGDLKR
jgi:hypothetical protein